MKTAHGELVITKITIKSKTTLIKKIEETLFPLPLAHLISCQEIAKTPTSGNVTE